MRLVFFFLLFFLTFFLFFNINATVLFVNPTILFRAQAQFLIMLPCVLKKEM